MNYIILISTPDSRGLVHKISSNLLDFNIEKNDEFVDKENEYFFMRTEISVEDINSSLGAPCGDFGNLGRFADAQVQSHAPNFQKTPQLPPQILELDSNKSNSSESNDSSLRGRIADSHEAIQNKNQIARSATLKALSGAGVGVVREGEGSDFAIQAPPPTHKKKPPSKKTRTHKKGSLMWIYPLNRVKK